MKRFWSKVEKSDGGCWVWKGGKSRGYGVFGFNGTTVKAYVFAWTYLFGREIKKGYVLHHTCENTACVNPDHLELVTSVGHGLRHIKPVDVEAPAIIHKLRAWRAKNSLSSRASAIVMNARGFVVSHRTLESWDSGARVPSRFAAQALESFLAQHPIITDAPKYARDKLSDEQVAEIRAMRNNGDELLTIAQRFGISESAVSRLARGERRKSSVRIANPQ